MLLRIKEIRNEKRMTLDELSEKSGVSKRMISAYEAGENEITFTKLLNIAKALDVPVWAFIPTDQIGAEKTETQFREGWERLMSGNVDKRGDLNFQQKYIDVLEQLVQAKNEIERIKNELNRK